MGPAAGDAVENGIHLDDMAFEEIAGESMGDLEWINQSDEGKENDDNTNTNTLPSNLKKPALVRNKSKSSKIRAPRAPR